MVSSDSGACFVPRFSRYQSLDKLAATLPCNDTSCPFLAPSSALQCTYVCTSALLCKSYNTHFTFPSSSTKRCEKCDIPGCALCSSPYKCEKCFSNFDLVGSRCEFKRDEEWFQIVKVARWVAGVAAIACTTYLKVPAWRKKRRLRSACIPRLGYKLDPWSFHREVLRLARLHHHWCKVRPWFLSDTDDVPKLAGLCVNPHRSFWLGIGLPLYYNFMIFSFVLILAFFIIFEVFFASWRHDSLLHALKSGNLKIVRGELDWSHRADGELCPSLASNSTRKELELIALDMLQRNYRQSCLSCLVLYLVGFVLIAVFAHSQKRFAQRHLLKMQAMRWHAVAVTGFPSNYTDELEVKEYLETRFEERLGRPVRLAAVSICYNAAKYGTELSKLLDRLITITDVERGTYSHELADTAEEVQKMEHVLLEHTGRDAVQDGATREEWVGAAKALWKSETCELLGLDPVTGEQKDKPHAKPALENDGEVFAVFESSKDCMDILCLPGLAQKERASCFQECWRRVCGEGRRRPTSPRGVHLSRSSSKNVPLLQQSLKLKVWDSKHEPHGVNFHHYGHPTARRSWIIQRVIMRIFALQFLLFLAVVVPANLYSLNYEWIVQDAPGGLGSKLYGIFISTANWLLCVFIAHEVTGAGCLRKDQEEVIIFCCFSWMCVFNFLVSVAFAFAKASATEDPIASALDFVGYVLTLGWEQRMSEEVFSMLYPGAFVGCLLWPLQGFLWPFLEGFLTLRLMRADDLTVRRAERRMEPLPIGLCWDYQGSITIPVQGFLLLFFSSDIMQWSLLCLLAWPLFFYCLQHCNHRRLAKMAMSSTPRLGAWVLASQGLVLGEIAAGGAFWACRCHDLPFYLVPAAFAAGAGLVWAYMVLLVRSNDWPWGTAEAQLLAEDFPDRSFEETQRRTLYDWLNCNPVLVLKSQVVDLTASGIPPLLPFVVGKSHAWEAQNRSNGEPCKPDTVWYEPGVLFQTCGVVG